MFSNNAYVTVWEIDKINHKTINLGDKSADVAVTTSRKNQQGRYETDFTGRVRFIGKAFEKIKGLTLSVGDRLQLTSTGVRNFYDKERRKEYFTFYCFDFEVAALKDKRPPEVKVEECPVAIDEINPDELPF